MPELVKHLPTAAEQGALDKKPQTSLFGQSVSCMHETDVDPEELTPLDDPELALPLDADPELALPLDADPELALPLATDPESPLPLDAAPDDPVPLEDPDDPPPSGPSAL